MVPPSKLPASEHATEPQNESELAEQDIDRARLPFSIAGIAASAGGLEAFKQFFSTMPSDSGIAFILVPHLDPTHRSLMVELLARETSMDVREVEQGMEIAPNCVYIIPPNQNLTIEQGKLQLSESIKQRGSNIAFDGFFRSLANHQQEDAIGIILSGTGSHGTAGLREIKAVGGLVIAQAPATAEYPQMPESAIHAGIVDLVLSPEMMPAALMKYIRGRESLSAETVHPSDGGSDEIGPVLELLRANTRFDFRFYRKNMLVRRIHRRMRLCQLDRIADYIKLLQENPEEISILNRDLLIGVTSFFRDPDAFDALQREVIADLVERQTGDIPIRVWVPACSTGEEAYSIAILFLEQFAAANRPPSLQVFASDLDEESVEVTRQGIYSTSALSGLSPERVAQFFVRVDEHHYQVNKQLRTSIVVTRHNLISDAPFSKLQLISCRNLLIYLELELQQKIISLFHFSLNDGGRLFLGCSESIGRQTDLFKAVSKKWRIYRRIGPARYERVKIPIISDPQRRVRSLKIEHGPRRRLGYVELTNKLLLARFAPAAAALIDSKFEVLNLFGRTSDYLEHPSGEITKDLMSLVRKGLRSKIRAACQQLLHSGKAHKRGRSHVGDSTTDPGASVPPTMTVTARVSRNGHRVVCNVCISLLHEPPEAEGLLLVTFQDQSDQVGVRDLDAAELEDESTLIRELEYEVETTREDLQGTIEELQTSNEEVMSMNEELQSANEELETSKEELQSFNEELGTVNSQLQDKMEDLEKSNHDFQNLLNSTEIATVFLDTDLRIVRFTPATVQLLHLIESDTGRPIRDFAFRFTDKTLLQDAGRVLDELHPVETEIRSEEGRSYLRRILPFRTSDNRIEGVAITFLDISERNALQRQLLTIASEENRHIGQDLHDSVGQTLTGLAFLAGSLSETLHRTSPNDVPAAMRIAEGLGEVLEQIRKLSKGLVPVEVEADGLMTALASLAEATHHDTGLVCYFESSDPVEIEDNDTATQLYRIAQEAVTNAFKAGAKHVRISLTSDSELITMSIKDDGRGITSSDWNSPGMGLKTMKYRAGILGATLTISALNTRGTLVTCKLFANRKTRPCSP